VRSSVAAGWPHALRTASAKQPQSPVEEAQPQQRRFTAPGRLAQQNHRRLAVERREQSRTLDQARDKPRRRLGLASAILIAGSMVCVLLPP